MKYIDIDAVDPGYSMEPKIRFTDRKSRPTQRQLVQMRRSTYVYAHNHGRWDKRLGVRPEVMRDWRGLERRYFELDAAWKVANQEFWSAARAFPRHEDASVIVVIDDPDDSVLVIHDDSYSVGSSESMIERLLKNPQSEGDFTLYRYDQGGRELGYLYRREGRLLRAQGIYKVFFEQAVIDRLSALVRDECQGYSVGRKYYTPTAFVIENEGRHYLFAMDHHGLFQSMGNNVVFQQTGE